MCGDPPRGERLNFGGARLGGWGGVVVPFGLELHVLVGKGKMGA